MPIGKLLIDVERFKTPVDTILILSAKKTRSSGNKTGRLVTNVNAEKHCK
jgi:hypothetical protein